MKYDKTNNNRSYLFGSLLAVADRIESRVIYLKSKHNGGETRPPSTLKWMQQLQAFPRRSWQSIMMRLSPYKMYLQKKEAGSYFFYEKQIAEILSRFSEEDFKSNAHLEPDFLLAYYLFIQEDIERGKMISMERAAAKKEKEDAEMEKAAIEK